MFSVCNNCSTKTYKYWKHPEKITKIIPFKDQYEWSENK